MTKLTTLPNNLTFVTYTGGTLYKLTRVNDKEHSCGYANPKDGDTSSNYNSEQALNLLNNRHWKLVEVLDDTASGVDANGEVITLSFNDIKDFMRVVVDGKTYIVFTNARVAGLPLYITDGINKPVKLDLAKVSAVYSQPSSDILNTARVGKLKFQRADTTKLLALQADVAKAEAALAAAKAALAATK